MSAKGIVVVKPTGGIEVLGRRKLKDATTFDAMLSELQSTVEKRKAAGAGVIDDLDVSQNKISMDQFDSLFQTLAVCGVKVKRYRMFGMPTLDDEAMQKLADFVRSDLTSETAPEEMHLSDGAITSEGFISFMDAMESSDLFPFPDEKQKGKKIPLYLRLENNFIEESILQEKVDAGVIRAYSKKGGSMWSRTATSDNHKVDLIVPENKNFQQKQGSPPSPEDAPSPKPVHDRKSLEGSGQKGAGKGAWNQAWQMWPAIQQWQQSWTKGSQKGRPPVAQTTPAGKGGKRPQTPPRRTAKGAAAAAAPRAWKTLGSSAAAAPGNQGSQPRAAQQVNPAQWMRANQGKGAQGNQAKGAQGNQAMLAQQWKQKGSANQHQSNDRSRTPAGRGGAMPPARPPPGKKGLPHPWEEHYSAEHGINYFWNSQTGEAVWERGQIK